MILILNQEDQNILAQAILPWRHIMVWMRNDAWLEDSGEICRGHSVFVGFGRENS